MNHRAQTLPLVALALLVASCCGVRSLSEAPAPKAEAGLSASEMRDLEVGLLGLYASKAIPLTVVVDGVSELHHFDVSFSFRDNVDRHRSPAASPSGTEGGLWRRGSWRLTGEDESERVRRMQHGSTGSRGPLRGGFHSFPWRIDAGGRILVDELRESTRVLIAQSDLPADFLAFNLLLLDHGSALTLERVDGHVVAVRLGEHRFALRERYTPEMFAPEVR